MAKRVKLVKPGTARDHSAEAEEKKLAERKNALAAFYARRHPAYADTIDHWVFLRECYRGGRAWFNKNIFRYHKEGETEFTDRVQRAYRFNHTREVVELVQKYLFKSKIDRSEDAPDEVLSFWRNSTKNGHDIDRLMRQIAVNNSIGGRVALVVDNNFPALVEVDGEERAPTVAEIEASGGRVYAYVVDTPDILDYAFDEDGDGQLLWIKLREIVRDDADPLESSGVYLERMRLWTRTGWQLYGEKEEQIPNENKTRKTVELLSEGVHNLGFVPVRLVDHTIGTDPYRAASLIDDIAYLDRAVANYLSSLDAIIQDQTFSQLAIPAQSLQNASDQSEKAREMGTKRIFTYDGGMGSSAVPVFLSPDPKQAGVILSVITKVISEIYHTIGLAGERTKEDNAVGIDNSSGVAKAYDFERVNSLLLSKAQSCEQAENWLVKTILAWHGKSAPEEEEYVTYPVTFDVMRLHDELVTAEALANLDAPLELRRQQMRQLFEKMLPQLPEDAAAKIRKDIDSWLEGHDLMTPDPFNSNRPGSDPVARKSRQGSVTADTE